MISTDNLQCSDPQGYVHLMSPADGRTCGKPMVIWCRNCDNCTKLLLRQSYDKLHGLFTSRPYIDTSSLKLVHLDLAERSVQQWTRRLRYLIRRDQLETELLMRWQDSDDAPTVTFLISGTSPLADYRPVSLEEAAETFAEVSSQSDSRHHRLGAFYGDPDSSRLAEYHDQLDEESEIHYFHRHLRFDFADHECFRCHLFIHEHERIRSDYYNLDNDPDWADFDLDLEEDFDIEEEWMSH